MEAFNAVIHGDLPPAGNRICLREAPVETLPLFPNYHPLWLDSGTSALAVALTAARQRHPDIQEPEVVIPAYCCPDLAAAASFAGVKVVVADIQDADAAFSATSLKNAISDQTIAVIAVNFLGVRENLTELRQLLLSHPRICLIEDNAQWFPDPAEFSQLVGDFVVFSFGRGKPLSLLGGGLLLAKELPVNFNEFPDVPSSSAKLRLKIRAYNLLLQPRLYQLLNRNPLIRLGETRYHALTHVQLMDEARKRLLSGNFKHYSTRSRSLEHKYDELFTNADVQYEPLGSSRRRRLLRYPLLLNDSAQRDLLLKNLQRAGLGATAMYQQSLPALDGMRERVVVRGSDANAANFAGRLITLPLHEGVKDHHLDSMLRVFHKHRA